MSGHIVWGCLALLLLIFAVDCAIGNIEHWLKERKRVREMRKWGFSAFDYGREKKL